MSSTYWPNCYNVKPMKWRCLLWLLHLFLLLLLLLLITLTLQMIMLFLLSKGNKCNNNIKYNHHFYNNNNNNNSGIYPIDHMTWTVGYVDDGGLTMNVTTNFTNNVKCNTYSNKRLKKRRVRNTKRPCRMTLSTNVSLPVCNNDYRQCKWPRCNFSTSTADKNTYS